MLTDGQPVVITELAPPVRVLTLAGKDRPEVPVQVAGEQKAVQTWYPGAHKASVQVMGTAEEPIVLRGWFHDDLSVLDGGPKARVALARGIMQGQNLCQLVWGDQIVRVGRITHVQVGFFQARRQRYEIRFTVDQANEAVALAPTPVGTTAAALDAALDAAVAAAAAAIEAFDTVKTIGAVVL